jgi:AcrR family transcriptional regulator
MEGIAARAGVGKATLYRRWKSREDVVAAAVADFVADIAIPDTGSVEEDLLLLERRAVAVYRGRPGRILPGLLAAMAAAPPWPPCSREGLRGVSCAPTWTWSWPWISWVVPSSTGCWSPEGRWTTPSPRGW